MKFLMTLVLGLSAAVTANISLADIDGTWQGILVTAPGSELTVQFIIEAKSDGTYSVLLNSPDSGAIKNVPASNVTLVDDNLSIEVADLEGAFEGKFANDSLNGNWSQVGESYPFVLTRYEEKPLSEEIASMIEGRWEGALELPGDTSLSIVMTFEVTDAGKLVGFMESPDQSPRKFPMGNLAATEVDVSFNVDAIGGNYKGSFSQGSIVGTWSQGTELPLTLNKASLDPRAYALDLTAEAAALLLGDWYGMLVTPVGEIPAVFRFVEIEQDFIRGYFASPDQGASDLPIGSVTVDNGVVEFTVAGGRFSGSFDSAESAAAATISGEFAQGGQKLPLTLRRGRLPSLVLDINSESSAILLGSWQGSLKTPQGTSTVVFRFEKDDDAKLVGFIDNADQGLKGARIKSASFDNGAIVIEAPLLRLQYNGTISDHQMTGKLTASGQSFDVVLDHLE